MKAVIDRKKCTVCGVCSDAVRGGNRAQEDHVEISDDCTLCGICVDTCEFGAISLPEVGTGPAADLASYRGVWVYCEWRAGELHGVGLELLGAGRALADKRGVELGAVLLGSGIGESIPRELVAHGADTVYVVDRPELARFTDEIYAKVLVELIGQKRPEILLAGATSIGRSFIPRVAASVQTGLTADCTELDISAEGLLLQTRPAFGGNIMATIVCPNRRPQMATVRPKVMKPVRREGREGRIEPVELPAECFTGRVEVLEVIPEKDQTARLTEADVIVSGGRGLRKAENFALLEELAQLVNGRRAHRAGSREGWIAPSHQGARRPNGRPRPLHGRRAFGGDSAPGRNAGLGGNCRG